MKDIEEIAQTTAVDIILDESSFSDFTLILIGILLGAGIVSWLIFKFVKK